MFLDRLLSLCAEKNTDISNVLRALGLSTSKGTAWRNGSIPNGEILLKLARHFHVSTDYLLGNTDDPRPADEKREGPAKAEPGEPSEDAILFEAYKAAPENVQEAIRNLLGLK